ncbi:hypothetical protein BDZ97DRAFT_836008 [Flammula alnicola]|nr:hypothetical protein BDZ97DRAFT_836008 [Flammula alnicola]
MNLKDHVSKDIQPHVISHMRSRLFDSDTVIPLWTPSSSHENNSVYVGDVGIFNEHGGFETFFNVLRTEKENRQNGYRLPSNFKPYDKNISELQLLREYQRADFKDEVTKISGFEMDWKSPNESQYLLKIDLPPSKHKRIDCSALYMMHGFFKIYLRTSDKLGIERYMREHHQSWREHVDDITDTRLQDCPLALIVASYQTKSWSLAAANWPPFSKKSPGATLRKADRDGDDSDMYFWSSSDPRLVRTKSAQPIVELQDRDEETAACHCVGVQATFVQEQKSWPLLGGSLRSNRTVRPNTSALTLPAYFPFRIDEVQDN